MAPTRDVKKVMIGTVDLYLAPAYTTEVSNDTALGANHPPVWKHPGFSEEGVNFSFEKDTESHYVEEQSNQVLMTVSESDFMVGITMVEDTLDNMLFAFGSGRIEKSAATNAAPGVSRLILSDELNYMALMFEGKNPEGFARRLYIPAVVSTGSVETSFRRNEEKRMYPAEFHAVCALSEISWTNIDAARLPA